MSGNNMRHLYFIVTYLAETYWSVGHPFIMSVLFVYTWVYFLHMTAIFVANYVFALGDLHKLLH